MAIHMYLSGNDNRMDSINLNDEMLFKFWLCETWDILFMMNIIDVLKESGKNMRCKLLEITKRRIHLCTKYRYENAFLLAVFKINHMFSKNVQNSYKEDV